VKSIESNLPLNATISLYNNSDGTETIEIAIPYSDNLIDLGYPRLSGRVKTINGTFSAAFTIDFLLLENISGDYIFEAETYTFQRNQFKTKQAMLNKLILIYSEYYDKLLQFNSKVHAGRNVINQISEHFNNSISKLKLVETDWFIELDRI